MIAESVRNVFLNLLIRRWFAAKMIKFILHRLWLSRYAVIAPIYATQWRFLLRSLLHICCMSVSRTVVYVCLATHLNCVFCRVVHSCNLHCSFMACLLIRGWGSVVFNAYIYQCRSLFYVRVAFKHLVIPSSVNKSMGLYLFSRFVTPPRRILCRRSVPEGPEAAVTRAVRSGYEPL